MVKTRFCPSPTGYMHLGNVRTALFNALMAAGAKGRFLLRIEDTDKTRSMEQYAEMLQQDLLWLGIDWQEGPGREEPDGPYWQSQRQSIYDTYYQRLEAAGLVYPCFCSDAELALSRKVQLASGQPPRYAGTCRALTDEQIAAKRAKGLVPTLRFQVPLNQTIEFTDLVRGVQRYNTDIIGDFIIRRADGTAPFIFCSAIDDSLMGVTHALRGEDHLANTPRQLLVLQALEMRPPTYGHISMIVGKDGSKLSKRHGSRSLKELREEGYLPAAIINYLSRLGHYYESNVFMDFATLASQFAVENLGAAPARYDADQLLYWQKEAIAHLSAADIWNWLGEAVHSLVPKQQREEFINTVRSNIIFPQDAIHWAQILFSDELVYSPEVQAVLKNTGAEFFKQAVVLLQQHGLDFKLLTQALQEVTGLKGKALFQPLRMALTGEAHGPEMVHVLKLLGLERARVRLEKNVI